MIGNDAHYSEVAVLALVTKNHLLLEKPSVCVLQPFMFSSLPHRNIYELILKIKSDGLVPDIGMLLTRATDGGIISSCGGQPYIKYLSEQTILEDNFDELVSSIVKSYKVRSLGKIAEEISTGIVNNNDVGSVISEIKNKLTLLEVGTNIDGNVINISDANTSMISSLLEKMENPDKIPNSTNLLKLDSVTGGYSGGDVWVIAGRPGSGKSSYLCNSMLSGVPSLLFSLEMRSDSLSQRIISIESGIPIFDIRLGKINKPQLELIKSTASRIKELPIYLDTTFYVSPEYLINTIRRYKKLHDIKVVYLDYIQLMLERSANATHDIGKVTRDLKLLANDLDITVVMASQLNRGVESRDNKRPLLSDMRQSGNIEEDADVVIGLYRDIIYNQNTNKPKEIELILLKQRQGPTGTIFGNFDDTTNKIYDTKDK